MKQLRRLMRRGVPVLAVMVVMGLSLTGRIVFVESAGGVEIVCSIANDTACTMAKDAAGKEAAQVPGGKAGDKLDCVDKGGKMVCTTQTSPALEWIEIDDLSPDNEIP